MSAVNTVILPDSEACGNCNSLIRRRVQFKYGNTRAYDYQIGDKISWGGNDQGRPARRVQVLGYPEDCPVCGYNPDGVYNVFLEDDVIVGVEPGRTLPYEEAEKEGQDYGYIILES